MRRGEAPSILVGLVIVPVLVYVASFVGSIHGPLLAVPWSRGSWVREFLGRQKFSLLYHLRLGRSHPYTSPGWSWLLLKRPIAYHFRVLPSGRYREVLALGSPLVWWAGILALAAVAARWVRKRYASGPEGLILAGFVWSYGPWAAAGSTRSTSFLFYILPAVPFLCLALAWVATQVARSLAGRAALALFSTAGVLLFAFYYPVLAAVPLSPPSWDRRILFHDCRGGSAQVAVGGRSRLVPDLTRGGNPPAGWCWV
jgi:dolichyl-phosphate-mannose--protein O-mannosyl transferase